jgi:hypothetical protein
MKAIGILFIIAILSAIVVAAGSDSPLTTQQTQEIKDKYGIDTNAAYQQEVKEAGPVVMVNRGGPKVRSDPRLTIVEGTVYNNATNDPIPFIPLDVYCRHNNHNNKLSGNNFKTNSQGYYTVWTFNILPNRRCVAGDTAWIVVHTDNGNVESDHVTVVRDRFYDHASVNAWVGVPEFSVWTVGIAVVLGALGLAFFRRNM